MFEIAFAIAIFSYIIYFLGLLGILYKPLIIIFSILYFGGFLFWKKKEIFVYFNRLKTHYYSRFFLIALFYLFLQAVVNSVGLFGPEIGFDAVWYHLTLPKLYLLYHAVFHIPGGVLYYSDMPRLTEMLYTAGMAFGSDFFARGIHFVFGILTCSLLYKAARKFFRPSWAIILPVIFYSNLVVGWESISGYIDLSRTFFTTLALFGFLEWTEKKEQKWFVFSAISLGLTISTKLLALPDLGIYTVLLLFFEKNKLSLHLRFKRVFSFILIALVFCLPWFAFSYVHTGNPIYPMLSPIYGVPGYFQVLNPLFFLKSFWETFAMSSDPINPLFLAILPFIIMYWKKLWKEIPLIVIFAIGGFLAWYFTPQTGGGRYILPYIPGFILLSTYTISTLSKNWQKIFIIFIFAVALISLFYRGIAVSKFIPVITGHETKAHFLTNHLQFNLGDFYDTDGYFAQNIKPTDTVLLYGFHNLYYVNFPFIDANWVKKGDKFNYIAVQGGTLPERFSTWQLIYFNSKTGVKLYSLNGHIWYY